MLDFSRERRVSLGEVVASHPAIKGLSRRQLQRWIHEGVLAPDGRRVRLEVMRVGGRVYTTYEAVDRCIAAQNGEAPAPPPTATPESRRRNYRSAERALDGAGIG